MTPSQSFRNLLLSIATIAAFFTYIGASYLLSKKLAFSDLYSVLPYRSAKPNPPKAVLEATSLGHWPVLVDTFWIRVLVDPSIDKVLPGEHSPMYFDILSASELDPGFFDLHFFGGNYLSVVRGDHEGARDILTRARNFQNRERHDYGKRFIDYFWFAPYSISIALGYLNMFELDNFAEAEKIFQEASQYPGAPDHLGRLAARLRDPLLAVELGVRITHDLLKRSQTDVQKKALFERLKSLEVAGFVFKLNADWEQFLKTHRKASLKEFLAKIGLRSTDPWGGEIRLNEKNQIETTTPRKKVFGL